MRPKEYSECPQGQELITSTECISSSNLLFVGVPFKFKRTTAVELTGYCSGKMSTSADKLSFMVVYGPRKDANLQPICKGKLQDSNILFQCVFWKNSLYNDYTMPHRRKYHQHDRMPNSTLRTRNSFKI